MAFLNAITIILMANAAVAFINMFVVMIIVYLKIYRPFKPEGGPTVGPFRVSVRKTNRTTNFFFLGDSSRLSRYNYRSQVYVVCSFAAVFIVGITVAELSQ